MRFILFGVLTAFLLSMASPALAVDYPCADNETECGGGGSESLFEEPGPAGGGPFQPPSTTACTAKKSRNQACRACVTQYYDNGQPTGYMVCGFVEWTAACGCDVSGTTCSPRNSSCTYYLD